DAVGAKNERFRKGQPERARGLEIDDEIEPGRLLYREVARIRRAENLADIGARATIHRGSARPVGEEAASVHELTGAINRRQPSPAGEVDDRLRIDQSQRTSRHDDRLGPPGGRSREQASERFSLLDHIWLNAHAGELGGELKLRQVHAARKQASRRLAALD